MDKYEQDLTVEVLKPVEIERKFLISQIPDNLESYEHQSIRQGYMVIGADGSEARLRDRGGVYIH